jgi:hypothetical protein
MHLHDPLSIRDMEIFHQPTIQKHHTRPSRCGLCMGFYDAFAPFDVRCRWPESLVGDFDLLGVDEGLAIHAELDPLLAFPHKILGVL